MPEDVPILFAGVYSTMIIEKFNEGYMVALIKGHLKSLVLVRFLSDYLIYEDEVIKVFYKTKLSGKHDLKMAFWHLIIANTLILLSIHVNEVFQVLYLIYLFLLFVQSKAILAFFVLLPTVYYIILLLNTN